jgi:hypothetical protein
VPQVGRPVSTESTVDLRSTLRNRLLTFVPLGGGETVASALGSTDSGASADGNLFYDRASDNIDKKLRESNLPLQWGVMRLKNRRASDENAEREVAELEVMLYARPRRLSGAMESIADTMDQAMRRYRDMSSGVIGCVGRTRNTLPPFKEPADSDVVQIMLEYTLVLWPAYLIQYHEE